MKKWFHLCIILSFLCFLYCCHGLSDFEPVNNRTNLQKNPVRSTSKTRYNSVVEYMGSRYGIINQPLSIEDARIYYSDSSLLTTHKALCVYVESMEQLHRLESDQSLQVFYHPFGYELLPDYSCEQESGDCGIDTATGLYTYEECGEGAEQAILLPTLYPVYVLWPEDKPIAGDLKYDCLFEAYLPEATRGEIIDPPVPLPSISGFLYCYDNRLSNYQPIKHVKIEYKNDWASTEFAYTDENGHFVLLLADSNHPMTVHLTNEKFTIRDSTTSNVKSFAFDISDYFMINLNNDYAVNLPTNFYLDAYKAAEYYFYGDNDLFDVVPKYDTLGVSIDIHAINVPGSYLGAFYYGSIPYICIWNAYKNNYAGASSKIFGTVNHELAHATNYAYAGLSGMSNTMPLIKESFASFLGWYSVLQYYTAYVGNDQQITNSICTQGRQSWTLYNVNPNYSPIYIDLFDDYNQHLGNSSFNDDPISGVSLPFIISSALGPQTFQSVYNTLQSGVGTYYSSSELSTFISPYAVFLP